MVNVYVEDGVFKVKGTFDFGYAGMYKDDMIEINTAYGEAREWECVKKALDTANCTDNDIAVFLTTHINGLEKNVQDKIEELNEDFLLSLFSQMDDIGFEFWEYDELTADGFTPEGDEDEIWRKVYGPASDAIQKYYKECSKAKKEGKTPDTSAGELLRKYMPMFNWDYFPGGVVPEHLNIKDGNFSCQCSDNLGGVILCCAWTEFDTELNVLDSQNF